MRDRAGERAQMLDFRRRCCKQIAWGFTHISASITTTLCSLAKLRDNICHHFTRKMFDGLRRAATVFRSSNMAA
jgi:hypothetical protein